jgi:hypothetical protein
VRNPTTPALTDAAKLKDDGRPLLKRFRVLAPVEHRLREASACPRRLATYLTTATTSHTRPTGSTTELPGNAYDLVTCRVLLHQIAGYGPAVLARMAAAVKPGGWLLVESRTSTSRRPRSPLPGRPPGRP